MSSKALVEEFSWICLEESATAPWFVRLHHKLHQRQQLICSRKRSNVACFTPKKREQTTLVSEFELTGSPLKIDMGYDRLEDTFLTDVSTFWSSEDAAREPLTLEEARNIINFYNTEVCTLSEEDRSPLWVICDGRDEAQTLLLGALSYKGHFDRGIVNYLETTDISNVSLDNFRDKHLKTYGCCDEQVLTCTVEGIYRITGKRSKILDGNMESSSKNSNGMTQLECEWTKLTLQVPAHETTVNLVQEVVIGHSLSICSEIWKSVCAIQGISGAVISLSSISNSLNIADVSIRPFNSPWNNLCQDALENKLKELLYEIEVYDGQACESKGGCICISDDCTSLHQVFRMLNEDGSSNDFTYKLWDILKNCNTVENLISLLVYALKTIYKKNLRPYIDPGNSTFLGGLVKKLARGSSQQAIKSLATLYSSPIKALNIIGQLGIAKTSWEYTSIFGLIDSALAFNDRLKLQNKISEINKDAINQTLLDMTLSSGDVTVNPFDTKFNLTDSTFVQEANSLGQYDNLADLTLDNFASLKKHNIEIKTEKLSERDQLFSDDVDIELSSKEWKFKTTRLAQLHVCMEHLCRSQLSLNLDFNSLKLIASQLLEFYAAENSPIKTVDQVLSEPVQTFSMPIKYKFVKEHLEHKHATLYRASFKSEIFDETKNTKSVELSQSITSTFICSQQQLFPPNIFTPKDVDALDNNGLYYYCTRFTFLSNTME